MDVFEKSTLSTPQKVPGEPEEYFLIENIERELENFTNLLEKSTEKERLHLKKIQEQSEMLTNLALENKTLHEENDKFRSIIDNYMKNFACFTSNLQKVQSLENENISLKQKLDQCLTETNDKIIDLELEKDKLQKSNEYLKQENARLSQELNEFKTSYNKLNEYIKDAFEKTISFQQVKRIEELEKQLSEKDQKIEELTREMKRQKDQLQKELKQKSLEYDLLKVDYQTNVLHSIYNKKNGDNKNEPKKIFKIIRGNDTKAQTEEPKRRTRGAYKRNKVIEEALREDSEDEPEESVEEEEYDPSVKDDEDEESYDEDDEDDYAPRKGGAKRKSNKVPVKKDLKKSKKSENKDLLLATRNTIQYHLFN